MAIPTLRRAALLRALVLQIAVLTLLVGTAANAAEPSRMPACPATPLRVVGSTGVVIDYLGTVPGIPDLCRMRRTGDTLGEFYLGTWRSDWPGAGQAYPALRSVIGAGPGARASFVTRSAPGLQWRDTFINEGADTVSVGGRAHATLKVAHEREGIEGNTYHSIITVWKDRTTGATLRVDEHQISGQSYGPNTTWTAVRVGPPATTPAK